MAHEMRATTLKKRSVIALVDESNERSGAKREQPANFGAPLSSADPFLARVPIAETKHKHSKSSTLSRPMRTKPASKKHDSQCYSIRTQDCAQFRDKSRRSKSEKLFTSISQSYQLRQLCLCVSIALYSSLVSSQLALAYQGSQSDQNLNSDSSPLPSASTASSSTTASSCFGGIQTFEKISMSTFENPSSQASGGGGGGSGSSNAGAFGSGILIQQDDQALTSECVNLCRSQSNCLSFVIDYNKFECKSYATTQQELQHEFDAKYQAARSVNNNTTSGNSNSNNNNNATANADLNLNGYLTSSSSVNFQHLLPSASSNYFEKICLDGIANRNQFNDACGQGRLWIIERVVDSFLDGYVEKEVTNVNNKDECSKLCIFETQFVCRSADYDQHSRLCRLSKEDRRTQPQAMRYASGSDRQYLENQCATPGPSSCVYETRKNVGIISMDALKFSQTIQDCQMKCNQESTFNCRSYSFHQQRCFLSGDDSTSLNSNLIKLPAKQGWQFGEKKCLVELCTKGVFTYEKVTGHTLRSALSTPIDLLVPSAASSVGSPMLGLPLMNGASNLDDLDRLQQESSQTKLSHLLPSMLLNPRQAAAAGLNASSLVNTMMMVAANRDHLLDDPLQASSSSMAGRRQHRSTSNLAITDHCRHSCDLGYLNCPAFTIDYKNNRCQRLDRNSQGRHHELVAREGFSYYEKICLRVPEIMSMCQDKYWIFERVLGYELAPRLYDRTLKFVQSRRDCEEYCLEEKQFQCRSALYNDETSDCKLSRYDRRLADQEGAYQRNFNPRISYLENQCIRDQGANVLQSCSYEQARDEPAYPTFTEHIEMVPPAASPSPLEQDGSQRPSQQHLANGSLSQQAASKHGPAYCEQLCNDNAKFECHSFGYYPSTAQCFLSGDDSISAPADSASTYSTGFTYYEKKCKVVVPTNYTQNQSTSLPPIDSQPPRTSQPADMNPYFQPPSRRPTGSEFTTTTTNSGGQHDGQPARPPEPSIPAPDPYFPERATTTTTTTSRPNIMIRPTFMGDVSTQRPPPPPSMISHNFEAANQYKCGLGHTFAYQRIPGFEPIGGYLTLLVKNNEQPGIVQECADLCKGAYECRAFVVDYGSNQCYAMLENSSVGLLSLRQTIGKDYFEGFCVADHVLEGGRPAAGCWNRTWLMDKIVDQAVIGVQASRVIANSDRVQCRQACLEERLFWCKSAMFDGSSKECKLYSIDRESMAQMRLVFTKGVDFFENQCQISSNTCPYDAIERDTTIVSVTKSVQAKSTFDCEHACNSETGFNCRSYTYLDKYPSLPNLCLLSSDSRSTSQKGSVRSHSRTLYAERNCYFRRPRIPSGGSPIMMDPLPGMQQQQPATGQSSAPAAGGGDPYSLGGPRIHHQLEHPQANADRADGAAGGGGGYTGSGSAGLVPPLPAGGLSPVEMIHSYNGPQAGPDDLLAIPQGLQACKSHQFTFERTFGYDFRLAQKERAPIAPTIGIAIACQQECLRRADRCQSFVVDYALPYQSCFLIADQVGANKKLLVRSPSSAYFEKVCLPRLGLGEQLESSGQYSSPGAGLHDLQHMDMSPGYSNEPWTPQAPQQPYYLQQQQQQLIQAYPSRSCPKLWSFERFVNHNFTAPSDRSADNIFTRAQCETLCLNEASFSCRAATYDYNTKLCRLFKSTRRTVMSQFIDLETNSSVVLPLTVANPEEVAAAAAISSSELQQQQVRPASSGRQLMQPTNAEPPNPDLNIDYMENTCAPEPSSCQYRQLYDLFSPLIERINHAVSLSDCQRQCDSERLFSCKSINYDPTTRKCMLVNEDYISLSRGQQQQQQQQHQQVLLPKKNSVYSEKGNCEMVSVQCNSQEMLVSINFDSPFRGRVMAKGNPEQCFLIGDGQTSLQFPIVFGPKCNSRQEGHNTFVNEVVIQQHPVIMTDNDKTVRVMCAFEAPEQTITLKNPSSRDNKTGIDVAGAPSESSRTRHDKQHQFNSVVSNKAAPPSVMLRILDSSGRDASMINLGDDLTLKIQMPIDNGQNSALGIFARNLAARSSNGESLLLIDNDGCPVDHQVFPALEVDPKDGRSLHSTFKAFRFPSSGLVNFEVQIRFCPERCQPVECHRANRMKSYGRRRKRRQAEPADAQQQQQQQLLKQRTPILQSHVTNPLEVVPSTLMKPGKAFQFVRELLLNPGQESELSENSSPRSLQDGDDQRASGGANQHQTSAPETVETMTEPSDGFDNPKSSDTVIEPQDANGSDQQAGVAKEPSQPNQVIGGADEPQNPVSTISESEQQPKLQSPSEKNILMHVDERILPATHTISNHLSTWGGTTNRAAPYGRFGPQLNLDQGQARRTATTSSPDFGDQPNSSGVSAADNISAEFGRPGAETRPGPGFGQANQQPQEQQPTTANGFQGSYPEEMAEQAGGGQSGKDMPLRFSILVGEGQTPSAASGASGGGWSPGSVSNPPQIVVTNSTNLDMDHIVVPGKDGQLNQRRATTSGAGEAQDVIGSTSGAAGAETSTSSVPNFSETPLFGLPSDQVDKITSSSAGPNISGGKRASYEQTFDAQPSNSVEAEMSIIENNSLSESQHADHHHQHRNQESGQRHKQHQPSEAAAASRDCQVDSGNRRLWTIIWTGAFVIAVNICLVIVSLALYFKKVHLRQNHSIVHASSSSSSDCPTNQSERRRRWPSVLLKSKNDLGTSLNAHEHFFCKLNSKPTNLAAAGSSLEFNWPNLSSSSSHSTISSIASPLPVSSVRIHQSRPSYKYPFDTQASIRNNFNPGFRSGIMDEDFEVNGGGGGQSRATYTNNIDETHHDMGGGGGQSTRDR